jgi:hypothetical protein
MVDLILEWFKKTEEKKKEGRRFIKVYTPKSWTLIAINR